MMRSNFREQKNGNKYANIATHLSGVGEQLLLKPSIFGILSAFVIFGELRKTGVNEP
jgi:hypothetical protein